MVHQGLKATLREDGKSWIVMKLSHGSAEVEIDASEISCSPIIDLIGALENCCIYGQSGSLEWDAEGSEYNIEFNLDGKSVATKITHYIRNRGDVLFNVVSDSSALIVEFWRGLKAFSVNGFNSNELRVIENYVKYKKS